ncbi:glycerophosphodiester phosphodiesterase [Psychrobacter frigidicola]|uniref:Glycerophosphodiester phosphodiesterase n=1 Tax=Psychrobacter frigidicola TaxID=45611 RepID=A0A5C7A4M2_9GAMM|nr:glycerophosphodiester phosphodiesterase [Psychrobacter frigidicola]TXD98068.1 glycerophosphodiester phosphodiesterase [Psychrobacter frigidicola]
MISLQNTRLIGHRGARSEAPENTLFGFQHAHNLQARGLSGVEFDVQLTADGHLVVFHDETLQRLCGLQSRIDQLSLTEIQRHLQSGHQIITLDTLAQALPLSFKNLYASKWSASKLISELQKRARNRLYGLPHLAPLFPAPSDVDSQAHALTRFTHIELEVKTHSRTDYHKLIDALTRYLVDSPLASLPIVLTSFDTQLLTKLQSNKLLTTIPRGLLVRTAKLLDSAPNTALQLGCSQLGVYYPLLTKSVIKNCHRYSLSMSAWTVNDIKEIKQLVKWQVDFIITDIPTQIL